KQTATSEIGQSLVSVRVLSRSPTGTYTLTITGVSSSLTHTATVTLIVNGVPDFTLSAAPASQTVIQGSGASYNLTIADLGGFSRSEESRVGKRSTARESASTEK